MQTTAMSGVDTFRKRMFCMVRPVQYQGTWQLGKAALALVEHVLNAFNSKIWNADRAVKAYKA